MVQDCDPSPDSIDWAKLLELRRLFIGNDSSLKRDYWASAKLVQDYDLTLAARIGWKWDGVLSEIIERAMQPFSGQRTLIDWGCGTGVAAERVLRANPKQFSDVILLDRSKPVLEFAKQKLRNQLPRSVNVTISDQMDLSALSPAVVLVSHVINELDNEALGNLCDGLDKHNSVVWIEAGTPTSGRRLIEAREKLHNSFNVLSPCPHQEACGMLKLDATTQWCHQHLKPPPEAFTSRFWRRFAEKMTIDLRSLPVSYLVLSKNVKSVMSSEARVIGQPRRYKPYCRVQLCLPQGGICETNIEKRDDISTYKQLAERPVGLCTLALTNSKLP